MINYKSSGGSNMEYKLIAFDMDGTLLNSNKQISKKTMNILCMMDDRIIYSYGSLTEL